MKIKSATVKDLKVKPVKLKKPFKISYKLNPYQVGKGRGVR